MQTTELEKFQPISLKIQISPAITWTELGLWSLLLYGALLGSLKRYAPLPDELVTIGFDALCFGLLGYVVVKRLLHSRKIHVSALTLPLILFMGFALVTIINPNLTSPIRGLIGWRFLASAMMFHFLGFYAFDDVRRIRRFWVVFWLIAGGVSLYGILQLFRGYTAVELTWIENLSATMRIAGTGRYRLMSTMGGGVDLGFFMALSITSLVGYMIVQRRLNAIKVTLLGLMTVAIVFTYVRASWAAVFVGIFYLLMILLWYKRRWRPIFPILAIILLFVAVSLPYSVSIVAANFENPALQERVASLANPLSDRSMLDRFSRWAEKWTLVEEYPFGLGVGMTGATTLRYPDNPGPAGVTMDNSYLKVLVETGWIGLGLFLLLLFTVLLKGNQIYKMLNNEYKTDALPLLACFVAFMIIIIFGEYIELNPSRTIIWILSGFLFSLPRLQRSEETRQRSR